MPSPLIFRELPVFAGVLFFAVLAPAAPVAFQTLGTVSSASDVRTNGTLVCAEYAGGSGDQVVNAVNFRDGFTDYSLPSGVAKGALLIDAGSDSYNSMLNAFAYDSHGNVGPTSLTLHGLTPGRKYEVQLWSLDQRPEQSRREMKFSDGQGSDSTIFTAGSGTMILGVFTADGSTQVIELHGVTEEYAKNLNAFQVRQVP